MASSLWQRPGIVILGIAVALLLWAVGDVLLVVFAGILLAVAFSAGAEAIARWTPLGYGISLVLVFLLTALVLGGIGAFVGPQALDELGRLWERTTAIIEDLYDWSQRYPLLSLGGGEEGEGGGVGGGMGEGIMSAAQQVFGAAAGMAMTALGVLSTVIFIFVIGGFMAANPGLYRRGFIKLVPQQHRARANEVLDTCAYGLRWWLLGQFVSMALLGVSTGIGLYLFGIDLWLGLALLTAILTFIPFLGPILAGIPIVAVALADGLQTGLFVLGFYLVVQNVEGNVVTPMIHERAVSLPPALLIAMQLLGGAIFGIPGFILAAPLTVVGMIAVNMLYIEDTLGDERAVP